MDEQTPGTEPQQHAQHPQQPATPTVAEPIPATAGPSAFRKHRGLIIGGATVAALGLVAGSVSTGLLASSLLRAGASTTQSSSVLPGMYRNGSGTGGSGGSGGYGGYGGYGFGSGGRSSTSSATAASASQKSGVVTIVSEIGYDGSEEAAGTGIILTSSGEILTNNHVVEGSTSIEVTIESTDTTYTAEVVGTDATDDIAVLQLVTSSGAKATGLTAAKIDTSGLAVGDSVTDVGNAGGTGDLVVATGTVSALDQSIQVADESTGAEKSLSGLVELDADIVSGDSGGPVLDAEGEVAAIATAASSGSAQVTGYAIPISTAMSIVDRIVAGDSSGTITIGLPAFLGVELSQQQTGSGVAIAGVIDGMPAAQAGLAAGSTITAVDGIAVASAEALSAAIAAHAVGDTVTITWTDAGGASHQASVTLVAGPAA